MARDDKDKHEHASGHLPVTGEVGSEGGSYADAAAQKATREGGLPRLDDADEPKPPPGEVAEAITPSPDEPEDGVRTKR